jgi:hypothetical protein
MKKPSGSEAGAALNREGVIARKRWKVGRGSVEVPGGELAVARLVERFDPEGS